MRRRRRAVNWIWAASASLILASCWAVHWPPKKHPPTPPPSNEGTNHELAVELGKLLVDILLILVLHPNHGRQRNEGTNSASSEGPSGAPSAPVATLRVDSPVVYLNGQPVIGSTPLFIGNDVGTGDAGRATIEFKAGGLLAIGPKTDSKTDPQLQSVSDAGCVGGMLLELLIDGGTFDFTNVTRVCFCNSEHMVCGAPSSDFRVAITHDAATISVTHGRLRVAVGPRGQRRYLLEQRRYMVVKKGITSGPQTTPVIP